MPVTIASVHFVVNVDTRDHLYDGLTLGRAPRYSTVLTPNRLIAAAIVD